MATVKKASVPPTHPSVYAGLALATVGLLVAAFAYTGTRIYDVTYALVALAGGILAFVGILSAAWGRSIMAARASRSRRGLEPTQKAHVAAETLATEQPPPTVAAPAEKKRFSFPMPKRREKPAPEPAAGGVFAFKRRAPEPAPPAPSNGAADSPLVTVAPPAPQMERVTLKCPQCGTQFTTEGTRPMLATCTSCGFSATV